MNKHSKLNTICHVIPHLLQKMFRIYPGDPEREKALRRENEDRIRPLPQAHLLPLRSASRNGRVSPPPSSEPLASPRLTLAEKRRSQQMSIPLPDPAAAAHLKEGTPPQGDFDFGFPSTPTEFQKNLMRFAFLPAAVKSRKTGWSTEYGRPDIPFMLREMSKEWTGRRTCVFVCGPPSMRIDVSNTALEQAPFQKISFIEGVALPNSHQLLQEVHGAIQQACQGSCCYGGLLRQHWSPRLP
ncbi:hypothetical protein E1952_14805 [Staphylococcus aureus]|nr:hypothetical protein E1952_14805 [Staphylococcus aureus]